MLLGRRGSGAVVLERPPVSNIVEERAETNEKDSERSRSSLTVIENPSLEGYLGIFMSKTTIPTIPDQKAKSLMNSYLIKAYGDIITIPIPYIRLAKIEQQDGDPRLYVISYPWSGMYPVASKIEYQGCRMTYDEFQRFETVIRTGNGLDKLISDITQLLGQRIDSFSLKDGKLVLPPNYANTRL